MGELNMAGWLEDHATDAARELGQEEDDRGSNSPADPLDALLERTYRLLNRPKLHSHHCRVCHLLRPCLQLPCHFRALDCEDRWVCGECVAGEEPRP
jgi:hypothetical protein